jgi:hypothetical protein
MNDIFDAGIVTAAAKLASAMAKGDEDAFGKQLDPSAKMLLDGLVASGEWTDATKAIEAVRIVTIADVEPPAEPDATAGAVVLAVQEKGSSYVVAFRGKRTGDNWTWTGAGVESGAKPRASAWDGTRPGISASVASSGGEEGGDGGLPTSLAGVMDAANMSSEAIVAAYLAEQLGKNFGAPVPSMTPEMQRQAKLLSEQAKKKIEEGTVPSAKQFRGVIEMVAKLTGKPEADLLAPAAAILKISPDKAKELYDEGGGAAPKTGGG